MNVTINLTGWKAILLYIAVFIAAIVIAWLLTRLNRLFFKKIERKQKNLQLSFFQTVGNIIIVAAVIILSASFIDGTASVWQTLLGGTAIVSAVIAFAAQDAIKDILAGLMISIYKPFEIGNRIVLDNLDIAGTVEDMTMRHVVIRNYDDIRVIVPNSFINTANIINYSFKSGQRSCFFKFSISYESDLELARAVIDKTVRESPYSSPRIVDGKETGYSPVYFQSFSDSALILAVSVYYDPRISIGTITDDINTSVRAALLENNIEIPYQHITLVKSQKD